MWVWIDNNFCINLDYASSVNVVMYDNELRKVEICWQGVDSRRKAIYEGTQAKAIKDALDRACRTRV